MVKNVIIGILSFISVVEFVFVAVTLNDTYKNKDKPSDNSVSSIEINTVNLGDTSSFDDTALIYESDKYNLYYDNNCYYSVSDGIVKQLEYNDVVPRNSSIVEYLQTFKDFNLNESTIICYGMDGKETKQDLSLLWKNCDFGSMVVYWKTSDSKGYLIQLSPNNVATISEYLYWSDLLSLIKTDNSSSTNN